MTTKTEPEVLERLDESVRDFTGEIMQLRLHVAQLTAVLTGEPVRVPLPLHL